jgi:lipopolysaccharide transport system permease protein
VSAGSVAGPQGGPPGAGPLEATAAAGTATLSARATGGGMLTRPGREIPLRSRAAELWQYRHLVRSLVVRDLKVRYRSSVLGFLWSLINPLLMMAVLSLVFGVFFPNNQVRHNHVFILVAILPWNWFSAAVAGGMMSVVANAPLINKVYFPREILPLSLVLSELVNFLFALPVLAAIILLAGIPLTVHVLWLPLIILIQAVFTLGIVLLLATANVYYRDTGIIMGVVLQAWFFLTPIFYDASNYDHFAGLAALGLSGSRLAYILNPMASLIANYRVLLYGSPQGPPTAPDLLFLGRTALTALVVLMVGYWFFHRHSGRFSEAV